MCVHEVGTCVRCNEEARVDAEENLGSILSRFRKKYCEDTRPNGVPSSTEWFDNKVNVFTSRVKREDVPVVLESLLPQKNLASGLAKLSNNGAPLSLYVEAAQKATETAQDTADWWDEVDKERQSASRV